MKELQSSNDQPSPEQGDFAAADYYRELATELPVGEQAGSGLPESRLDKMEAMAEMRWAADRVLAEAQTRLSESPHRRIASRLAEDAVMLRAAAYLVGTVGDLTDKPGLITTATVANAAGILASKLFGEFSEED